MGLFEGISSRFKCQYVRTFFKVFNNSSVRHLCLWRQHVGDRAVELIATLPQATEAQSAGLTHRRRFIGRGIGATDYGGMSGIAFGASNGGSFGSKVRVDGPA